MESVAFSPDGETLASASERGAVWLWSVGSAPLTERACRIANRNLSAAEWDQFMGDRDYACTCPELPPSEGTRLATCPERAEGR